MKKILSFFFLLAFAGIAIAQVPDYCIRNNNRLKVIKDGGDGVRDALGTGILVTTTGTCHVGTHWISTQVNKAASDLGLPIYFVYQQTEAHSGERVQEFYTCGNWMNMTEHSKLVTPSDPAGQMSNAVATVTDLAMPNTVILLDDGFVLENFSTLPSTIIVKMVLHCGGNPYFVDVPLGCGIAAGIKQVYNGFQGPGGSGFGRSDEEVVQAKLEVFPNPAVDHITVSGVAGSVTVCDVAGRTILSTSELWGAPTTLDISGLPEGVYIVRSGTETKKLVIARRA